MTFVSPNLRLLVAAGAFAVPPALFSFQDARPVAAVTRDQASAQPAPSREEQELFLRTAAILKKWELTAGTTRSMRATLSDGRVTHDAHLQFVDIYRPVWRGKSGTVEKNFRDSYKFNIAAYRLDKMLGLNMTPVSVEREVDGKWGSMTWWIDDVWIDEAARRDRGIKPPADDRWLNQLNRVRVFDQLICNTDRNQGNLLITPEWKLWIIDHSRAFRTRETLPNPETLRRIDKPLLEALRGLTLEGLTRELGGWLRAEEVAAVLKRRDAIVRHFDSEIREKGVDAVLTGIPRSTPEVSVP